MKKRIQLSIFFTAFISTLIVSIITVYVFYGFFVNQAKHELKNSCTILKDSINMISDNESYLVNVKQAAKYMRLTLVSPDGTVTFDSKSNYEKMDNHFNREEIKIAREKGFGESVRHSNTIGKNTIYYAFLLSDGYILRCSQDLDDITSVFLNIIPLIIGITILLIFISLFIAKVMTRNLIKPVLEATKQISNDDKLISIEKSYDELQPFINKLTEQKLKIKQQIKILQRERDTINAITENMQEGLIVINLEQKILSANKSAINLLNGSFAFSYIGKPIISLISEEKLISKINNVLNKGESVDKIISKHEKEVRLFINPVYENEKIKGAIIILLDITQINKAEKIRREFSANVSHELKTPLTSISGFAEMIESGIVSNEKDIIKFTGNIHKEATRLLTLIEDIIRLTEIEDNLQTMFEDVDLLKICQESIESLSFLAEKKGITIQIDGEKSIIKANKSMIYELLYNLIDNAIKYNKQNGKVLITIKKEDNETCLIVEDTGIGIEKEHLDRIFERFYRVDKSRSKQNGGTGLGLSIVKHIVSNHNAKLFIESEFQKGTKITITFINNIQ